MNPSELISNAAAIPITVALVRILGAQISVNNVGKVILALAVAAACASAVELAGMGFGWRYVPVVTAIAWTASMGTWNGGKTIVKAITGNGP